tara:strand:- start:1150 stop:1722 length:573 start_codon:yes stop_codon:yes gene_type:complete
MSFVRKTTSNQFEETKAPAPTSNNLHIRIDVAPIPLGATKSASIEEREMQTEAIEKVKKMGKDLFAENQTVVSTNAGERLYQTKDLYGQNLSLEDMIPQLTSSNLTLRVNAIRSGVQSQSTCMELKTGILADLLEETADSNHEKNTTLEIPNNQDKGTMYVSVKEIKGKHYINKVDYKVNTTEDDRLHIK